MIDQEQVRRKLALIPATRRRYIVRYGAYRTGTSSSAYYAALERWGEEHPEQLAFWRDHPSEGD